MLFQCSFGRAFLSFFSCVPLLSLLFSVLWFKVFCLPRLLFATRAFRSTSRAFSTCLCCDRHGGGTCIGEHRKGIGKCFHECLHIYERERENWGQCLKVVIVFRSLSFYFLSLSLTHCITFFLFSTHTLPFATCLNT